MHNSTHCCIVHNSTVKVGNMGQFWTLKLYISVNNHPMGPIFVSKVFSWSIFKHVFQIKFEYLIPDFILFFFMAAPSYPWKGVSWGSYLILQKNSFWAICGYLGAKTNEKNVFLSTCYIDRKELPIKIVYFIMKTDTSRNNIKNLFSNIQLVKT